MAVTQLSPQDAVLLSMIQDGRVDAEIAVRLGVATSEVKERVDRLIQLAGARTRNELRELHDAVDELRDGAVNEPARASAVAPAWQSRVGGVMAGVLLGAAAAWAATVSTTDQPRTPATNTALETQAVAALPAPALAEGTPVLRDGRAVVDAGQVFSMQGRYDVLSGERRGEVWRLTLAGAALFRLTGQGMDWDVRGLRVYPATYALGGTADGTRVMLHLIAAKETTRFLAGAQDSLTVYSEDGSPELLAWIEGRAIEFSPDGRLFIDSAAAGGAAVVAYDTGEDLDVSTATPIGVSGSGWNGTFCGEGEACYVVTRPGPSLYPLDGELACSEGVLRFSSAGFNLEFHRLSPSGPADPGCEPYGAAPVAVNANEPFLPARHYRITAFDSAGAPLSVVAGRDGQVYVGDVRAEFACPCRQGS